MQTVDLNLGSLKSLLLRALAKGFAFKTASLGSTPGSKDIITYLTKTPEHVPGMAFWSNQASNPSTAAPCPLQTCEEALSLCENILGQASSGGKRHFGGRKPYKRGGETIPLP